MSEHSSSRGAPGRAWRLALAALVGALAGNLHAQDAASAYPNQVIKLVVPIPAGSATDALARAIATELQKSLGTVVVENKAGANGTIGSQFVARAPADGYTLLFGTIGTHSVNEYLYRRLPYDPVKDFTPVSLTAKVNNVIVVPATSSYKTLADLVAAAKKNPGKLNYGIGTVGSSSHLATEMFKSQAGVAMTGIPYQGPTQMMTDLIAGRIDMGFDTVLSQVAHIQAGQTRPLAQTASQRVGALRDVPTVAEAGFPGFEASGWNGIFVPAGTPVAIVHKLLLATQKAVASPELKARFSGMGIELVASRSSDEFARFLVADRQKWAAVIKTANIKVDQ